MDDIQLNTVIQNSYKNINSLLSSATEPVDKYQLYKFIYKGIMQELKQHTQELEVSFLSEDIITIFQKQYGRFIPWGKYKCRLKNFNKDILLCFYLETRPLQKGSEYIKSFELTRCNNQSNNIRTLGEYIRYLDKNKEIIIKENL